MEKYITSLVKSYLETPAYKIVIKDKLGHTFNYKVSALIPNSHPEFKIEKKQHVLVMADDRPFPYVMGKEILNTLSITSRKLK